MSIRVGLGRTLVAAGLLLPPTAAMADDTAGGFYLRADISKPWFHGDVDGYDFDYDRRRPEATEPHVVDLDDYRSSPSIGLGWRFGPMLRFDLQLGRNREAGLHTHPEYWFHGKNPRDHLIVRRKDDPEIPGKIWEDRVYSVGPYRGTSANEYEIKHSGNTFMLTGYLDYPLAARGEAIGGLLGAAVSRLTPYVGAGLGAVRHRVETRRILYSYRSAEEDLEFETSAGEHPDFTNWNLAWSATAGTAVALTDKLAVDIGYRFTDLGHLNSRPTSFETPDWRQFALDKRLQTHEARVGLRYEFGPTASDIEALEAPASARALDGFYVRADVGKPWFRGDLKSGFDITEPNIDPAPPGSRETYALSHHPGVSPSLGLGYRFGPRLRFDVQLGWRPETSFGYTADLGEVELDTYDHGYPAGYNVRKVDGKLGAIAADLTGYLDFPLTGYGDWRDRLTPYVGAGVGIQRFKAKIDKIQMRRWGKYWDWTAREIGIRYNDSDWTAKAPVVRSWVWTGSLAAGTAVALGERLSLDLGYRFTAVRDIPVRKPTREGNLEITLAGLHTHEARAGLRYEF